jgi:hypothetical protein
MERNKNKKRRKMKNEKGNNNNNKYAIITIMCTIKNMASGY